jgi:hypothetical protein
VYLIIPAYVLPRTKDTALIAKKIGRKALARSISILGG